MKIICALFLVSVMWISGGASIQAQAACDRYGNIGPNQSREAVEYIKRHGAFIVFRHAKKYRDGKRNAHPPRTCAGGECLCEFDRGLHPSGIKQARRIGDAFRDLGIKVEGVFASPYCRTVQTAALMFDIPAVKKIESLREGSDIPFPQIIRGTRSKVDGPASYVFVTHSTVMPRILGITRSPSEGVGAVLRKRCYPESGDRNCVLACISHKNWR